MKYKYLVSVIFLSVFLGACASGPAKTEAEVAASVEGEIVGTPAPDSKFSKLKIGLTPKQVAALIGPPTDEFEHPAFAPGGWVTKFSYKGEGLLTFNYTVEHTVTPFLTRVEVNTAE